MWPLKERVVVVTGASSGIGWATSLAAARAGAQVVVAARNQDRLHELAGEIRRLGAVAHVFPVDLSDHAAATWLIGATIVRVGRIDVLVNNAGYGLYSRIEDGHPDDFERIFQVNVLSPMAAMRAVIPTMRRQGEGHIVNVASVAASWGFPTMGAYSATKAALIRVSEAARLEVGGSGVRVSVVSPGPVTTGFVDNAQVIGPRRVRSVGQVVTAEYVAHVILRCVRTGAADVTIPWYYRFAFGLTGLMPGLSGTAIALGMRLLKRRLGPDVPAVKM